MSSSTSLVRSTKLGLQFEKQRGQDVDAGIKWLLGLVDVDYGGINNGRFGARVAQRFSSSVAMSSAFHLTQRIINQYVYFAYTPESEDYVRSYALLNSFKVQAIKTKTSTEIAGFTVYSDPDAIGLVTEHNKSGTAEAKLNSGYSYAAFFLDPDGFGSFLKNPASGQENRHRDWLTPLLAELSRMSRDLAVAAIRGVITKDLPRAR